MRAELGHTELKGRAARVLIIDQLEQGTLVPLGWYLSAPARHALDEQSKCVARALLRYYPKAGEATIPLCDCRQRRFLFHISSTPTTQALHIKAVLDENTNEPVIKGLDEELATLVIERDEVYGEWNHR